VIADDGANFGGAYNYAHLLKIVGLTPNNQVETVTYFMEIPFRKMLPEGKLLRRYVAAGIAVDSIIYVFGLVRRKPLSLRPHWSSSATNP